MNDDMRAPEGGSRLALVLLVLVALGVGVSLAFGAPPKPKTLTAPQAAMLAAASAAKATGCGTAIASHVYNPDRLTVYSKCVTVTGTVVDATKGKRRDGVRKEKDGDTHGWIRLDPAFTAMLNTGNRTHEGSNLVFEVVCFWAPTQPDAVSACPHSYANKVTLPPIGSHVAMTGAFVQDENHQHWMEIHPVTKIRILP